MNKVLDNTVQYVRYINARKNFAHEEKIRNLIILTHTFNTRYRVVCIVIIRPRKNVPFTKHQTNNVHTYTLLPRWWRMTRD